MKRYKLIISDFDGSLVGKDLRISQENLEALKELRENGLDITLATGRRLQSVKPFMDKLGIKLPVILYNGAGIYDPVNNIWLYRKFLDPNIFKDILEFLRSLNLKILLGVYWKDELWELEEFESVDNIMRNDLVKFFIEAQREVLEELKELLEIYYKEKAEIVFSGEAYLEILPKGCSKGNAMLWLVNFLNISPKEVIAIGDYDNDIDLLEKAGLGIALPDSSFKIKEIADYIALSGPELILEEILKKFIRSEKS
ncbi:MAG: Cof-type HAD-IIB family hydrolase [Dictyoglomus sp.]|nr:Cof-type HAD-IIB family hydrolase [Dictyoglomus sp.]MCX7942343.1 Cof-type HAD-IIB family hydrolase [Dictyoglomaceae bacterium]MDW8188453.1 Cof-type HAD-IIB family hydrolase [Dictyoglomus sp.]